METNIFWKIVEEGANECSEMPAIVFESSSYTYKQLLDAVCLCEQDLLSMGVQPKDHVAIWSFNDINWLPAFFAILHIGATAVLVNAMWEKELVVKTLKFVKTDYLLYGNNRELLKNPNAAEKMAECIEITNDHLYDIREEKTNYKKRMPAQFLNATASANDGHFIIFTSGTADMPKAVELSQEQMLENIRCGCKTGFRDLGGERAYVGLPFWHAYGVEVAILYLYRKKMLQSSSFLKAETMLKSVEKSQITDLVSVSTLLIQMVQLPEFSKEKVKSIHFVAAGGSVVSAELIALLFEKFSAASIYTCYGQTEAASLIASMIPKREETVLKHRNSVGQQLPDTEIEIWDGRKEAETGKTGEILFKGKSIMIGYYGVPKSEQPIDKDGWLHTGDCGYLDEDGYLYLVGRMKDIIIKNGENISAAEIESYLIRCPGIQEAKAVAERDPVRGEAIGACLILTPGFSFDENKLREQLSKFLPPFKMPLHFWIFENFPRNANGKIDREKLQEEVRRLLN